MEKGTKRAELINKTSTNTRSYIPTLLSQCFLTVRSPGSLLVLLVCCPAHTVLLRSPDSLMLLCEFSSLLFLDPAWAERVEERREEKQE